MKYQLVLQFKGDTLRDYDSLIGIEDALIPELGSSAEVDGHDFGSGTANIFIYDEKPTLRAWNLALPLRHAKLDSHRRVRFTKGRHNKEYCGFGSEHEFASQDVFGC